MAPLGRQSLGRPRSPRVLPPIRVPPAFRFGLHPEYDVPGDIFMAMELTSGAGDEVGGLVRYDSAVGLG